MATWPGWERDVLTGIQAPINADTSKFMLTWHSYEGGAAANNPMNTTQPEPGATDYNSVHVKNYPSSLIGTRATVTTLENGYYPAILAALRSGRPFSYGDKGAVSAQVQKWGTFGFAAWYSQQGIAAQPGTPPPAPSADVNTASGHRGYADLRNSVARHLPTQLSRSRSSTHAALQTLAHGRRVKR